MLDRKVIIGLVGLQFILCVLVINLFPIALDEPFSIYHAQFPLNEMLPELAKGNNSPLHFVALHFWIKLFGISPFSVRFLSVIVSLISVGVTYKFARKFWKVEYAALVVGFLIFSRLNHLVAMEARMYGFFTLFFILILKDIYALLIENKKVFLTLGLWNALLLYTHYLGGVVVVMECILFVMFYSKWTRQKWIQVLLTMGIALILFIPEIKMFIDRAGVFQSSGTWVSEVTFQDLWTNLVKLMNNQFALILTIVILLVVIRLAISWSKNKENKRVNVVENKNHDLVFFSLWFFGLYGLMFVISLWVQPIFFIKYLQFISIPLYFTLVAFISRYNWVGKWRLFPLITLIPFILSFKPIPDINRETDLLVEQLKEKQDDHTLIYYCPPHYNLTLAYHYDRTIFENFHKTSERLIESNLHQAYHYSDIDLKEGFNKLIFVDFQSRFLYPDNGILTFLDKNCIFESSLQFDGEFVIYCYQY